MTMKAREHPAVLTELLDLIAPQRCLDCGVPAIWCVDCRQKLVPARWVLRGGMPLISPAAASPLMMRAIAEWKDAHRRVLTPVFAEILRAHLEQEVKDFEGLLVTLPSRRSSARRRGYAPMAELAQAIERQSGSRYRYQPGLLRWISQPGEQRGLADAKRALNVAGRLETVEPPDQPFLIIDDVVTSGSTMLEALRALAEVGTVPVALAALAVPRHSLGQDFVKSVAKAGRRI